MRGELSEGSGIAGGVKISVTQQLRSQGQGRTGAWGNTLSRSADYRQEVGRELGRRQVGNV